MLKVYQTHSMVTIIEKEIAMQEVIKFLLLSDLHIDHPKCHRELLKVHLDEAVERGAYIMINGDTFCVMQGRNDKRHNKGSVRPEDMNDAYFDSVIENAYDFLEPYLKRILFIGFGNHESAIIKRVETNLLKRFVDLVYYKTGHRIALGEYHGWIWIKGIYIQPHARGKRRQYKTFSYCIYHNHGTGGEAPVTGGSIEDNRKMTQVEGADAIWQGHNHNKYDRQVAVHYLDRNPQSFKPKFRIIDLIRTGTYKQEYTGHGFHIETNKAAKPLGGTWLNLKYMSAYNDDKKQKCFVSAEVVKTWHEPIEIN